MTYMDQIDADALAIQFLESRACAAYRLTPHVEIRWHNHESDGRTGSLWVNGQLAAVTVVLRDDLNRSALVMHELPGFAHLKASTSAEMDSSTGKDVMQRRHKEIVMERPRVTQETISHAAQKLAAENGWDADRATDLAKTYRSHMDGYKLAKELESRCHWNISVMDVDALDCMDSEVREIHRAACLSWAKEHDIQPPLPIGTMTTKGEITGISTYDAACYLVRGKGEINESRRLIVRFEDAHAAK